MFVSYLQMVSKPNLMAQPNQPLGGIVLVPLDCVTIIHGELMMEIVIAFSECYEGSQQVISRRVLVIVRRVANPMGNGIDTRRRLN